MSSFTMSGDFEDAIKKAAQSAFDRKANEMQDMVDRLGQELNDLLRCVDNIG